MNIKDYMNNPAGKGAVIPGKKMLVYEYDKRYNDMIKTKPIQLQIYSKGDAYFYHFLITTEAEERDNAYDVVLKFTPVDFAMKIDGSLKNWTMQIFSNCPSFTFTYAYVAKLNELLIPELQDRYKGAVLSQPPTTRNPSMIFNFEKSVYYACKYILDKNYLAKSHVNKEAKKLTSAVFEEIRNTDQIEEEIQRAKAIEKANKGGTGNKSVVHQPPQYTSDKSSVTMVKNDAWKKKSTTKGVNTIKPTKSTVKDGGWKKKSTVKKIKKK